MLVSDFLTKVSYCLRGLDDDPPTVGTDEATYWIDTYNRKKDELYEDVTKNWSTAYSVESLGTVTVDATPSFNLPAEFLAPSGRAYILKLDGQKTYLDFIKPNEAEETTGIYIAGQNPQVLYYTEEVKTGQDIVGGTLYLPGYFLPDDVTDDPDVINVPDPNWAVNAVAAEIAFADITYEDKGATLSEKANALYLNMVKKNRRGTYGNPRTTLTKVKRIRGTGVK